MQPSSQALQLVADHSVNLRAPGARDPPKINLRAAHRHVPCRALDGVDVAITVKAYFNTSAQGNPHPVVVLHFYSHVHAATRCGTIRVRGGLSNVHALNKEEVGPWRGRAMRPFRPTSLRRSTGDVKPPSESFFRAARRVAGVAVTDLNFGRF